MDGHVDLIETLKIWTRSDRLDRRLIFMAHYGNGDGTFADPVEIFSYEFQNSEFPSFVRLVKAVYLSSPTLMPMDA